MTTPLDWDDLRIFLGVARARRIGAAAATLGIDPTTVLRRLARLERICESPLFENTSGERLLTEQGAVLLAHAETIESAALSALGQVRGDTTRVSGQVRLSVAEGFATWVLAPALPAFPREHPGIRLDLVTASGFLNPSKREADMAVMLARPRRGRLTAAKLGNYRLRLYASAAYLARTATPMKPDDLRDHGLIGYVPEFIYAPELDYLGEVAPGLEPMLRSTSINVQHRLIASGGGIGVLPEFIGDRDPTLVVLLGEEVMLPRSFWLVTHHDVHRLARIETVSRWLRECVRDFSAR
ncbi:LysR family transcriptional regulator [Sphingomonas solaris]|uniref:LysR family transcriptional regulator n=1 Tax=Alterirhizorhabdus solaris TaxID=2529389 RepID=A0A558RCF0_9SPHN|nr:LysR substrate-binding domain-containing protein [Sphingomonas solaris]TVV77135.1 LysR family transcriptional regulator [Sphingomonas solaris]